MAFFIIIIVLVLTVYFLSKAGNGSFPLTNNHIEGKQLEESVNKKLRKYENDEVGGKVIHNCILKWQNETTTQIDNILITKKGIFVIECKDYRGWIFGTDTHDNWTEVYPNGQNSQKYHFYNPLKQNNVHIRCLRNKIKNQVVPVFSIVVFSNECEFKSITNNTNTDVIKERRLSEIIDGKLNICQEILSPEQIQQYYTALTTDVEMTDENKRRHIENVQRIIEQREYEKNSEDTYCPRCGFPLVLKMGQYGKFYSCSRYPDCRYTKKTTDG